MMAWCVYCRNAISDDAERCPSCEKPLTDGSKVIRCPSCGKYILKNSKQCRYCGKDPHAASGAEEPAPTEKAAPTKETAPAEEKTPAEENVPAEKNTPVEETASTEEPAPAEKPSPAEKAAPTERPAPPAAAKPQSAKAKPKKRRWLLLPLVAALAVGVFFGARTLLGKKDSGGETREAYIASCKAATYALVSRDAKRYEGDRLTFSGTVTELVYGGTVVFHIDQIDLDAGLGSGTWYAAYTPADGESVLRAGDEITVYGECAGSESYTLPSGESVTLPAIRVAYYEAAELDKLLAARQGETFGVGETWTVDGLCAVTVTGVAETKDRNPDAKTSPAAVYYVDYTYTNLGYRSESSDGIYIAVDEIVLDSAGKIGYAYPNRVDSEPRPTPVGETCAARCCIGLDHVGPFQLTVTVNDPVFTAYTARFNINAA